MNRSYGKGHFEFLLCNILLNAEVLRFKIHTSTIFIASDNQCFYGRWNELRYKCKYTMQYTCHTLNDDIQYDHTPFNVIECGYTSLFCESIVRKQPRCTTIRPYVSVLLDTGQAYNLARDVVKGFHFVLIFKFEFEKYFTFGINGYLWILFLLPKTQSTIINASHTICLYTFFYTAYILLYKHMLC